MTAPYALPDIFTRVKFSNQELAIILKSHMSSGSAHFLLQVRKEHKSLITFLMCSNFTEIDFS